MVVDRRVTQRQQLPRGHRPPRGSRAPSSVCARRRPHERCSGVDGPLGRRARPPRDRTCASAPGAGSRTSRAPWFRSLPPRSLVASAGRPAGPGGPHPRCHSGTPCGVPSRQKDTPARSRSSEHALAGRSATGTGFSKALHVMRPLWPVRSSGRKSTHTYSPSLHGGKRWVPIPRAPGCGYCRYCVRLPLLERTNCRRA